MNSYAVQCEGCQQRWRHAGAGRHPTKPPGRTVMAPWHCRTHLSAQKTPTVWVQVADFPLTGSGKVQKFAIRESFLAGIYGTVLDG